LRAAFFGRNRRAISLIFCSREILGRPAGVVSEEILFMMPSELWFMVTNPFKALPGEAAGLHTGWTSREVIVTFHEHYSFETIPNRPA
jgi:hypothetical protein